MPMLEHRSGRKFGKHTSLTPMAAYFADVGDHHEDVTRVLSSDYWCRGCRRSELTIRIFRGGITLNIKDREGQQKITLLTFRSRPVVKALKRAAEIKGVEVIHVRN